MFFGKFQLSLISAKDLRLEKGTKLSPYVSISVDDKERAIVGKKKV